jgi:phosphatidylserine/phosphatidylglycerophosphate/cardiolipin synthase-like enzyme
MTKRLRQWSGALLGLGVTLAAACGPVPMASPATRAPFTQATAARHSQTLMVMPTAGTRGLVEAIDNAKSSVDVEVYILTSTDITDAMTRAAKRGVQVRCLLEPEPFNPNNPNNPLPVNNVTRKKMADSGVFFRWTNKETFTFTHQKSMVVDRTTAYIMTMNLSKGAMADNREFVIVERDPQRAKQVQNLFDADWTYDGFDGANLGSLVLSPVNARSQLTKLIESAKTSLVIEIEVFYDPAIFDLLAKKQKQGVAISVLLPSPKQIDFGLQTVEELRRRGITNIRFIKKPVPHCKLIVADAQRAYIGSVNLTTNSMDKNRELGIILDDPSIVSQLVQINQGDWAKGEPFPSGTLTNSGRTAPRVPVSFDTGV